MPDISYGLNGGATFPSGKTSTAPTTAPDIGSLLGPKGALTQQQADYNAKASDVYNQMDALINANSQEVARAYHATGIGPNDLKGWNEPAEREKFMTKPVDAFGSVASVFAIIASAFTLQPMQNALNGSAAAINAIRAGDENEYEKAHTAWKENLDLAMKRHQM